ncbi:SARP family transcriptional regulator [Paractinoplanes abujensis]|uniref:Putative ATPase/DNA-binding SARP family transcriptional activator n=1 Tax=Paractinoplanes abujensis TaxID=882441 RepID=A0A7W7CM62_9ACTN|nr:BTAD domain-containing putative transcriptional regulator [Actinoplanes abujensis]MBB4691111.1 putative ATPase/DNA-binding SARP family transcriptional activator [Actinoplanes abujensis]GID17476.1 SARP family transcriptional regulator [Actinoplanes abujensis]
MPYGVLGPTLAGRSAATGGARQRALLARLLLDAGRTVPLPRLIDDVYGDEPPAGAVNAVQSGVSRLRRDIPISYDGSGYRLDVERDEVDVHRFARLAAAGRDALRRSDFAAASPLLTEALALWRGEALADVRSAPFAAGAADRLEECRRQAVEDRADAGLGLRPSDDAVDELRTLLAAAPLRERAWALLMRALVAGGRPAEALAVFEEARRTLADELGADPSPELAAVHTAVLRGAPLAGNRLPAPLTSFVGRDEDMSEVAQLLRTARLVTLLGPGGAGKTRLSLEVAARRTGAVLVELAGTGPADVPRAVADALGLRETALLDRRSDGPDAVERLLAALATRDVLLVLDNCEHVVAAAAALAGRLLVGCPDLRVLATSREPLGVTGEVRRLVPGLPADSAVRLFADRAAEVTPGFTLDASTEPAVRDIVRTLDGLPLAVELAAARLPVLGVEELARRVGDRFRVLSRGSSTAAERHRTLRAVVAWSWDLLTEQERTLAARFTVFRGGAGLDAIEQVCGPADGTLDVLDGLVSKSLIERDGSRYRMLSTIRAFCAEQLREPGTVVQTHAAYFRSFAQQADARLRTPDQLAWLDRLDADRDNLHAAVRHGPASDGLRLVAALSFYWWLRGARGEASVLARELLGRVGPVAPDGLAEEYVLCTLNAGLTGPPVPGLHPALFLSGLDRPPAQPFLLYLSAVAAGPPANLQGNLLDVQDALTARLRGSPWSEALAAIGGGWLALFDGHPERSTPEFEKALAGFRALGERWGMMLAQSGIAEMAVIRGDHAAARAPMDEALRLAAELRSSVDLADLLRSRGDARMLTGDDEGAAADFARAMSLAAECGATELVAAARVAEGRLALRRGDASRARDLCLTALAECPSGWYSADGTRLTILLALGRAAEALGDPAEAAGWYRKVAADAGGPDGANAVAEATKALAALDMG